MLLSPSRNLVRKQRLETQIAFHELPVKRRQLVTCIRQKNSRAEFYKMAYTKSDFSEVNIAGRLKHGQKVFTNEAQFDPSAQKASQVLQKRGKHLALGNRQKKGKKGGLYYMLRNSITSGIWRQN